MAVAVGVASTLVYGNSNNHNMLLWIRNLRSWPLQMIVMPKGCYEPLLSMKQMGHCHATIEIDSPAMKAKTALESSLLQQLIVSHLLLS